jgi:hypothetical protein
MELQSMQKPRKLMPYHWVMILNNKRFNKILMNIFIITAAGEGHKDIVEYLLKTQQFQRNPQDWIMRTAYVNSQNKIGWTPLMQGRC